MSTNLRIMKRKEKGTPYSGVHQPGSDHAVVVPVVRKPQIKGQNYRN